MCALTAGFDTEELAFRQNREGLFEPGSVCELNRRRMEETLSGDPALVGESCRLPLHLDVGWNIGFHING